MDFIAPAFSSGDGLKIKTYLKIARKDQKIIK